MATYTGKVLKAYSPSAKSGYQKFFFEIEIDGEEVVKGMAPAYLQREIVVGNTVELDARLWKGWLNPNSACVIELAERESVERFFKIGHVGQPKLTHFGWGCYANYSGKWAIVTCAALTAFFENKREDRAYPFPNGGRGAMHALAFDADGYVITEVCEWIPEIRLIEEDVPFSSISWSTVSITFKVNGSFCTISTSALPFAVETDMLHDLNKLPNLLRVRGTAHQVSDGLNAYHWETDEITVSVSEQEQIEILQVLHSSKISRATAEIRAALREIAASGKVVDTAEIAAMFFQRGIEPTEEQIRDTWARGYDVRYLSELEKLAGADPRIWSSSGYFIEIGDWIVWERAVDRAATYILPAQAPANLTSAPLSKAEWIAALAQILPETNKMDLRYGEVGQALSGCAEGVQFAFHVQSDDGEIDGWIEAVRAATENAPTTANAASTMTLDDILALTAGE